MNEKQEQRLEHISAELKGFPPEPLERMLEFLSRHSYSVLLGASHSVRLLDVNSCSKIDLIMISGRDGTDEAGKETIPINELLCATTSEGLPADRTPLLITREPNVVVPPQDHAPTLLI